MGSPNSLDCILRQASPGVGNLRLFSLLVAWLSALEVAVSWGFLSHHCSCCFPVGMSPGASLDLLGCGSCCSPGGTSPGASMDIPSDWSFCLPGVLSPEVSPDLSGCGFHCPPVKSFPGDTQDLHLGSGFCCPPGDILPGRSQNIPPGHRTSVHTVVPSAPGPPLQPTGQVGRPPEVA